MKTNKYIKEKTKSLSTILFLLIINTALMYSQNTYISFDTLNNNGRTLPEQIIEDNGTNYVDIQYNFSGAIVTDKVFKSTTYNFIHIKGFGKRGK